MKLIFLTSPHSIFVIEIVRPAVKKENDAILISKNEIISEVLQIKKISFDVKS